MGLRSSDEDGRDTPQETWERIKENEQLRKQLAASEAAAGALRASILGAFHDGCPDCGEDGRHINCALGNALADPTGTAALEAMTKSKEALQDAKTLSAAPWDERTPMRVATRGIARKVEEVVTPALAALAKVLP